MSPKAKGRLVWLVFALAALGSLLMPLFFGGCATRGGWPCWVWEKNTDQKVERAAREMEKSDR